MSQWLISENVNLSNIQHFFKKRIEEGIEPRVRIWTACNHTWHTLRRLPDKDNDSKKILLIEQDWPAHVIKFFCNGLRIFRSTQFMQTCLICSCKCYWTPIEMRLFRLSLGRTRSSVGLRKKITSRNSRLNDATTCDYVRSPKFLVVIDQQSETRVPLPDDQE